MDDSMPSMSELSTRLDQMSELEHYLGFPFCKSEAADSEVCQVGIGTLSCPCSSSLFRSFSTLSSPDIATFGHFTTHCPLNASPFLTEQTSSFLYTLLAPTSAASKITDESLTFLNQGQSYELKLKKISDQYSHSFFESVIRITFHERRLQYAEKEQFENWVTNRKDEKMIEFDVPLMFNAVKSDNVDDVANALAVRWFGHEEATVGLKVNCISTEFTAKKHGGEKGVPLRMQIETYALDEREADSLQDFKLKKFRKYLHSAYCLVKIFKPNGADRKNKNDQLKISKMTQEDKANYQPSFENTVFRDIGAEGFNTISNIFHDQTFYSVRSHQKSTTPLLFHKSINNNFEELVDHFPKTSDVEKSGRVSVDATRLAPKRTSSVSSSRLMPIHYESQISHDPLQIKPYKFEIQTFSSTNNRVDCNKPSLQLTTDLTSLEIAEWLRVNNFDEFLNVFRNFSGADLFRLSRKDLVEICGLADGIRLHNAIHSINIIPKLTLFVQIRTNEDLSPLCKTFSTDSLERGEPTGVSSTVTTATLLNKFQQPIRIPHVPVVYTPLKNAQSLPELITDERGFEKRRKIEATISNESCLDQLFHPIYLSTVNICSLAEKLANICRLDQQKIQSIFHRDKEGFIVLVTDDFVENMVNRSRLLIDVIPDNNNKVGFQLILQTVE